MKFLDKLVADASANKHAQATLDSGAVIHFYGGGHLNFQINATDAFFGSSPGEE